MAKAVLRAATFRPAEIQKITGITPDTLRDHRKRGYVEETEGWTAANLVQTARLIIVSRLSAVEIPPAASWEIARHEGAAEQIVAFALDFDGAVVDHKGRAVKTTIAPHLGSELIHGSCRLLPPNAAGFYVFSDWKSAKAFFTNDAKKIYFTQSEIPLLTLDLKAYGALLFDKAGKPLIQIQEDG